MMFSARLIQILSLLLSSDRPIPAGSFAENMQISKRTVFRELENVDKYLKENELELETKSKKGIIIGNSSKEIDFAKNVGLPILLLENFSKLDLNDPTIMYYQKIRQLSDQENYSKIYKAQSWDDIYRVINEIIKDF